MSTGSAPRIEKITIGGLFGAYDYVLPPPGTTPLGDTVILYGDNGCGKTTILQLVFHMLSAANNKRHRGTLFRIPFKSVCIAMTNGAQLAVSRPDEELVGPYDLTVQIPGRESVRCRYDPRQEGHFFPQEMEKNTMRRCSLLVY
jgi:hypothetical protein